MADTESLPKWWLKNPPVLERDHLSFLCDVCKHINFKFLLFEATLQDCYTYFPLDSYSNILEKQYCAFCRLVKKTLDNKFGLDILPTQYENQDVMVKMTSAMEMVDHFNPSTVRRHLHLSVTPISTQDKRIRLEIHEFVEGYTNNVGKGSIMTPQIKFALAVLWNRICCNVVFPLHQDHTLIKDGYCLPTAFRLIDIKKKCIVKAEPEFQYIALSYVWGKGETLKLTKDNYTDLTQENGLVRYEKQIPQTIKDAMLLVEELLDRYLWVDALCIIQNSLEDKKSQISAMDQIYGSSHLTIAATGDGADAGLPGVRPGTRKMIQGVETIQGLRLANRPMSWDESVEPSAWNTRAWIFQERILTKRILFVAEQQIFFKCDHSAGYLAEDVDRELKPRRPVTFAMEDTGKDTIPDRWCINTLVYQKTVQSFVVRNITYNADILNAFEGIAQRMRSLFRSKFLYGLPESELDSCLLWEPLLEQDSRYWFEQPWDGPSSVRRRNEKREIIFPSWSWAGWIGPIQADSAYARFSRIKWVGQHDQVYTANDYRAPFIEGSKPQNSNWREAWTEEKSHGSTRYFEDPSNSDLWFSNPVAPEAERNPRFQ